MPSPLLDRLLQDIKQAMKDHDKVALGAMRMLHAAVKDLSVNQGLEASDDLFLQALGRAIKQRQDAIAQYRLAGRQELADKEQLEIDALARYQPAQLDAAEIEALARAAVAQSGAQGPKDMGKVMGILMPQVKGKADGKLVNQVVKGLLGSG